MKKISLAFFILCTMYGFSQTEGISYQAVILNPTAREIPGVNAEETILANSPIAIQFTIVDDLGSTEYQEYHRTSTDAYGMINLLIGGGTATSNTSFTDVIWIGNSKKLKVGIDFSGSGSNYTALGTQTLSYMPQPANADIVAAIAENAQTMATISASIAENGSISDPATVENTIAITNEITRALAAEAVNAAAIVENASNSGISTIQANAITANTAKVGLSAAQETLLGNTSGENSGDQNISGIATNTTAIALNTAKTGITSDQASAITDNTAKLGVPTGGSTNQILTMNGSGVASWTTSAAGGAFNTASNVTSNSNGAIATDDFVFGSTSLNNISGSSDDSRLFFDKGKSAFRAGRVTGVQWDYSNLGDYSTAMGLNNIAKGLYSTAIGEDNQVNGKYSTAIGEDNEVNGNHATALGDNNQANGRYSITIGRDNITDNDDNVAIGLENHATENRAIAIGIQNISNGNIAIAMGGYNESNAHNAMTFGYRNIASGSTALAIGGNNLATSSYAIAIGDANKANGLTSTAIGSKVETEGNYATAFGRNTKSKSYGETTIGFYNTDYSATSVNNIALTDRLFTIGNGASNTSRSDALVMLKNGNTTVSGNWSGPAFTATSDIRLKEDIADLGLGMAVLKQINTKQYYLKKDTTKQLRFGVIAQEIREILPNLVYGKEGENSYLSVNYTELIPILINALKEQDTKINALENQNIVLQALVQRVENLEKK